MKFVLISLVFGLALGHFNKKPCQPTKHTDSYATFLERHILQEDFDRNSGDKWKKYLEENDLCDRRRQTFMEKEDQEKVEQICQGSGSRYNWYGNLCISGSRIFVYDLKVDNNCRITKESGPRYVVVACDAINNVCLPVHFEKSTYHRPRTLYGRCD